jgi:hypothetical protein
MYCTDTWSKTRFSPAQSMDSKQQGIVVADKDGTHEQRERRNKLEERGQVKQINLKVGGKDKRNERNSSP